MKKTFLIIVLALLTMVMSAQTYGIDHIRVQIYANVWACKYQMALNISLGNQPLHSTRHMMTMANTRSKTLRMLSCLNSSRPCMFDLRKRMNDNRIWLRPHQNNSLSFKPSL